MAEIRKAIVAEKIDEGDRVLLYPEQPYSRFGRIHVIASPQEAADVDVGDVITYDPAGFNFGWFKSKLASASATAKAPEFRMR